MRYASLIGSPVAGHAGGRAIRAQLSLDSPSAIQDLDARSSYLPAMVVSSGVSGEVRPGQPLALALNGRVAGVTRAAGEAGALHFDAILDPRQLRAGRNRFEALVIERVRPSLRLAKLQETGHNFVSSKTTATGLSSVSARGRVPS